MSARVLVSDALPPLRSGNPSVDAAVENHLRAFVADVYEQLRYITPQQEQWTAAIRGAGTAGTYEIASQQSWYCRIGDWVYLSTFITLAGSITGGGTGNLNITGVPFTKIASHHPVGQVALVGVNWTAGAHLGVAFTSTDESTSLYVIETNDDAASAALAIGALAANDQILATIAYLAAD